MKVEGGQGEGGQRPLKVFSQKNHKFRDIQTSLRDSLKLNFSEVI